MTRYISTKDTAKLVRKALAERFPGTKFSVRCDSYALGSHIDVSWTDGPTYDAVREITQQFEGSEFDAMQDLKSYVKNTVNGEDVQYGADSVHCQRHISQWEAKLELAKEWIRLKCHLEIKYGQEYFGNWSLDQYANRVLDSQDYTKGDTLHDALMRLLHA